MNLWILFSLVVQHYLLIAPLHSADGQLVCSGVSGQLCLGQERSCTCKGEKPKLKWTILDMESTEISSIEYNPGDQLNVPDGSLGSSFSVTLLQKNPTLSSELTYNVVNTIDGYTVQCVYTLQSTQMTDDYEIGLASAISIPENLTLSMHTDGSVLLSWAAPAVSSHCVTNYNVSVNNTILTSSTNAINITLDASDNSLYCASVAAMNFQNSFTSYSSEICFILDVPNLLSVSYTLHNTTSMDEMTIEINWSSDQQYRPPLLMYHLSITTINDGTILSIVVIPPIESYLVENLTKGVNYTVAVFGENAVGNSTATIIEIAAAISSSATQSTAIISSSSTSEISIMQSTAISSSSSIMAVSNMPSSVISSISSIVAVSNMQSTAISSSSSIVAVSNMPSTVISSSSSVSESNIPSTVISSSSSVVSESNMQPTVISSSSFVVSESNMPSIVISSSSFVVSESNMPSIVISSSSFVVSESNMQSTVISSSSSIVVSEVPSTHSTVLISSDNTMPSSSVISASSTQSITVAPSSSSAVISSTQSTMIIIISSSSAVVASSKTPNTQSTISSDSPSSSSVVSETLTVMSSTQLETANSVDMSSLSSLFTNNSIFTGSTSTITSFSSSDDKTNTVSVTMVTSKSFAQNSTATSKEISLTPPSLSHSSSNQHLTSVSSSASSNIPIGMSNETAADSAAGVGLIVGASAGGALVLLLLVAVVILLIVPCFVKGKTGSYDIALETNPTGKMSVRDIHEAYEETAMYDDIVTRGRIQSEPAAAFRHDSSHQQSSGNLYDVAPTHHQNRGVRMKRTVSEVGHRAVYTIPETTEDSKQDVSYAELAFQTTNSSRHNRRPVLNEQNDLPTVYSQLRHKK